MTHPYSPGRSLKHCRLLLAYCSTRRYLHQITPPMIHRIQIPSISPPPPSTHSLSSSTLPSATYSPSLPTPFFNWPNPHISCCCSRSHSVFFLIDTTGSSLPPLCRRSLATLSRQTALPSVPSVVLHLFRSATGPRSFAISEVDVRPLSLLIHSLPCLPTAATVSAPSPATISFAVSYWSVYA